MPGLFEGANRTLTALKISYLEQLNSKIFALLSTLFSRLKIDHLIKQIGISYFRPVHLCNHISRYLL
ncbi:hypothetical protein CWC22_000180 [Pseudoalteromonas rubra]|uniref:Uncharacterized protein n=1 Tax=Pseudoalteromonas rubra TaxID=43658 RepID=A0A7S7YZR2_9GAMM|nr:hypothetical protein CWC22_000180 [Pseudoalteromonas rubra]